MIDAHTAPPRPPHHVTQPQSPMQHLVSHTSRRSGTHATHHTCHTSHRPGTHATHVTHVTHQPHHTAQSPMPLNHQPHTRRLHSCHKHSPPTLLPHRQPPESPTLQPHSQPSQSRHWGFPGFGVPPPCVSECPLPGLRSALFLSFGVPPYWGFPGFGVPSSDSSSSSSWQGGGAWCGCEVGGSGAWCGWM